MLYVHPTPQYPRSKLEARMKTLYSLINGVTFCCMTVLIVEYAIFLPNSLPEYYTNSQVVLSPSLSYVLLNCTYTGEIHLMNAKTKITTDKNGITLGLLECAQYITALFSLSFVTIIFNALSLGLYRDGNRHARFFGVHLSLYHCCVATCYFLNFAIIGTTFSFYAPCHFFEAAISHCAALAKENNADAFYDSEFTNYTIFSAAVLFPFAGACINLFVYFLSFVARCILSNHRAEILLSEADAPWERRGVICRTSKPLLSLHTAQRKVILEEARAAMKEGMTVRIARSYQLLTEEDYNEMVDAMRKQVEENLKEEQFQLLLHNFGEDQEAWDNRGFMWRDSIPWDLPTDENIMDVDKGEGLDEFNSSFMRSRERSGWTPNGGQFRDEFANSPEQSVYRSQASFRQPGGTGKGGVEDEPLEVYKNGEEEIAHADTLEMRGDRDGQRRAREYEFSESPEDHRFSIASPLSDDGEWDNVDMRRSRRGVVELRDAKVIRHRSRAYNEADADELW